MTRPEPTPDDTKALVRAAQSGDHDAAEALMVKFRRQMEGRVRVLIGPEARQRDEFEDHLQELWLDVIKALPHVQIEDEESFLRWATHIARNNVRDRVRHNRNHAMQELATSLISAGFPMQSTLQPERVTARREDIANMEAAMATLPADYQIVIELRDLSGLSFEQIGERMGRAPAAVQMLHSRALVRLAEKLRPGSKL